MTIVSQPTAAGYAYGDRVSVQVAFSEPVALPAVRNWSWPSAAPAAGPVSRPEPGRRASRSSSSTRCGWVTATPTASAYPPTRCGSTAAPSATAPATTPTCAAARYSRPRSPQRPVTPEDCRAVPSSTARCGGGHAVWPQARRPVPPPPDAPEPRLQIVAGRIVLPVLALLIVEAEPQPDYVRHTVLLSARQEFGERGGDLPPRGVSRRSAMIGWRSAATRIRSGCPHLIRLTGERCAAPHPPFEASASRRR